MTKELQALQDAQLDAFAAATAVWERDGKQDRGSCGGAILMFKGGRKLTKVALESGFAYGSAPDIYAKSYMPDGIRSQNADIPQAALRAFRDRLTAEGFGEAIAKFWTYVD